MSVVIKISCIHRSGEHGCSNKLVKKSFLGLGPRLCVAMFDEKCRYQQPLESIIRPFIERLPKKIYNKEQYGLMFMVNGDVTKGWTCTYWSHFMQKSEPRIPTIEGEEMEDAARNMYNWLKANLPHLLN